MRHYSLILASSFWDAVMEGRKTFEVRKNDRGFNAGDTVEFCGATDDGSAGRYADKIFDITYVLSGWGIEPGYVVFGIKMKGGG